MLAAVVVHRGPVDRHDRFHPHSRHGDSLASTGDLLLAENQSATLLTLIENNDQLSSTLSIYASVASSEGLPYGTALVVQYVAAIVGSVVGFLLQ